MGIDELIRMHNEALEQEANQDPFLHQRLKAKLRETSGRHSAVTRLPLGRSVVVYGVLLIVFTFINFIAIGGIKKQNHPLPVRPQIVTIESIDVLNAEFPGSISHAYGELFQEEK